MTHLSTPDAATMPAILLVTGPSGAGRSTAIRALEDIGFEVIDNLPLSLLPRLLDGPAGTQPIALGLDVRNRDFGTNALISTIDELTHSHGDAAQLLFLDAHDDTLIRRYSETRRNHPLAKGGPPLTGIAAERDLLGPIRARADILIDTSGMTPHDLRAEVSRLIAPGGQQLTVSVQSFSFKRGLPRGLDVVLDCRFLRNPHWDAGLRALDGRDAAVDAYVAADPLFDPFFDRTKALIDLMLPAQRKEGKAHVAIGFGCTGGQHRSVAIAERFAASLAEDGWPVSKRHREIERRDAAGPRGQQGQLA